MVSKKKKAVFWDELSSLTRTNRVVVRGLQVPHKVHFLQFTFFNLAPSEGRGRGWI